MNNKKKISKETWVALTIFCIIFMSGLLIKASGKFDSKKDSEPQRNHEAELWASSVQEPSQNQPGESPAKDRNGGSEENTPIPDMSSQQFGEERTETDEETLEDLDIHSYQIVIKDCTWEEAFLHSIQAGGHLMRINSKEEFDYITEELTANAYTKIHFYLGGRRQIDGTDYYWVNEEDQFIGKSLNGYDSWSSTQWYSDEPSYLDTGTGANGSIQEYVMNLFCVSGKWYLNDSSEDLPGNYPDYLAGKVGYIVEYE